MAEGLLRKLLTDRGRLGDFRIESAGTYAADGAPATASSVDVCAEHGIDIGGHVARSITKTMIERASLILTMEPGHRHMVLAAAPQAEDRCFVITKYGKGARAAIGIPDPIGQPREEYEATFRQIEASIQAAMPRILALFENDGASTGGSRT
jgi:protein-tyrosine phosphatase